MVSSETYCSFFFFFKKEASFCKKKRDEPKVLTHSHTMTPFDAPGKQAF